MIIFDPKEMENDFFSPNLFDDNLSINNESINDYTNSQFNNLLSSSLFLRENSIIANNQNKKDSVYYNNLKFNNDDSNSDFLYKKRNREEEKDKQDEKIYVMKTNISEINNNVKEKIFKLEKISKKDKDMININKKKCGRKKTEELKERAHNKNCEDNIINKIKTHFFLYLYEIINENVENEKYKIKKLPTKVISNLNVIDNEEMWNNTLSDILKSNKISKKYSTFDEWENKKIVEKIEKNKKEIKVKKLLNLKFNELFAIFRRKLNDNQDIQNELIEKIKGLDLLDDNNIYCDFHNFIKKIEIFESHEYIENIKDLCLNYENWFKNKVARIITKKEY